MIEFSKVVKIDDEMLFRAVVDRIFNMDTYDDSADFVGEVCELPEEAQRLIFAKIGTMMIDYSKSKEF